MIINRHNYEEVFLLYMDNELDRKARCEVEEFVAKNPDLKDELDTLMQFKLSPDTDIVFENKSRLTKLEDGLPVNAANYQEWLLLYVDNELTSSEAATVDEFLAKNPAIKPELALLQQAKLRPDMIVMPGKQSLYRRETRRIPMRWWKVAAAALLILTAGITTAILIGRKPGKNGNEVAGNQNKVIAPLKTPVIDNKKDEKQPGKLVITNSTPSNNKPANKEIKHDLLTKGTINKPKIRNQERNIIPVPVRKEEPVVIIYNNIIPPSNHLPQPINSSNGNRPVPKNDIAGINVKEAPLEKDIVTPDVVQTSYNPDEDLNQSGGKKSKLRGFLRKVTRTFEKNTNINAADDDNRLLIGGLAFKLK